VSDTSEDSPLPIEEGQTISQPILERAIGVIYRPETELQSHYFQAVLPVQLDEYAWLDETRAVRALSPVREGMPDTYPFGV
jgi:protein-L-isoaspartate(D-aspartate) O-methyltransferase